MAFIVSGSELKLLTLLNHLHGTGVNSFSMSFVAQCDGYSRRSAIRYAQTLKSLGLISLSRPKLGLQYSFEITKTGHEVLNRSRQDGLSQFRKLDSCAF
jgi:DNA-binding IclR family transcriptional regulator